MQAGSKDARWRMKRSQENSADFVINVIVSKLLVKAMRVIRIWELLRTIIAIDRVCIDFDDHWSHNVCMFAP